MTIASVQYGYMCAASILVRRDLLIVPGLRFKIRWFSSSHRLCLPAEPAQFGKLPKERSRQIRLDWVQMVGKIAHGRVGRRVVGDGRA